MSDDFNENFEEFSKDEDMIFYSGYAAIAGKRVAGCLQIYL